MARFELAAMGVAALICACAALLLPLSTPPAQAGDIWEVCIQFDPEAGVNDVP
jgi:hypothetical protein